MKWSQCSGLGTRAQRALSGTASKSGRRVHLDRHHLFIQQALEGGPLSPAVLGYWRCSEESGQCLCHLGECNSPITKNRPPPLQNSETE